MPYVSTHFGIDVEFRPNMEDGQQVDVDINIAPVVMGEIFKPTKIGTVYLNGNPMTAVEPHEQDDLDALEKLRETLGLETNIPFTIYTFAEVRVRRYEAELEKCRKALKLAQDSLKEITIDAAQFDFGPAYAGAEQRQADAIRACANALRETK